MGWTRDVLEEVHSVYDLELGAEGNTSVIEFGFPISNGHFWCHEILKKKK